MTFAELLQSGDMKFNRSDYAGALYDYKAALMQSPASVLAAAKVLVCQQREGGMAAIDRMVELQAIFTDWQAQVASGAVPSAEYTQAVGLVLHWLPQAVSMAISSIRSFASLEPWKAADYIYRLQDFVDSYLMRSASAIFPYGTPPWLNNTALNVAFGKVMVFCLEFLLGVNPESVSLPVKPLETIEKYSEESLLRQKLTGWRDYVRRYEPGYGAGTGYNAAPGYNASAGSGAASGPSGAYAPPPPQAPPAPMSDRRLTAGLLGIFLGWCGVHRFYLGYTGIGIAQIFVSIFTGIGALWGFIEGICILCGAGITKDAQGRPI